MKKEEDLAIKRSQQLEGGEKRRLREKKEEVPAEIQRSLFIQKGGSKQGE